MKGVGRLHSGESNTRFHVGGDGVSVGETILSIYLAIYEPSVNRFARSTVRSCHVRP
jgi:hypothetical protein